MSINKSDLVLRMRMIDPSKDKKTHAESLDTVLKVLEEAFASGHGVTLTNFGHFKLQTYASRKARNPHTGGAVVVPEQRKLSFKAAPVLKARLNGKWSSNVSLIVVTHQLQS